MRSLGFGPRLPLRFSGETPLGTAASRELLRLLPDFEWLEVVKQSSKSTPKGYCKVVERALHSVPTFDYACLLEYLRGLQRSVSPGFYSNHLAGLKQFSRFIGRPELLQEFNHPVKQYTPRQFFTREQVVPFYNALNSLKMKALFLLGATTGLRKCELIDLRIDEIDHGTRMIVPKVHSGRTKLKQVYEQAAVCILSQAKPSRALSEIMLR